MKALVYGGPGKIDLKEVPVPLITRPTDALVKMTKTTICGTDLGIIKGKVPDVKPGTTLGHEGVGVIEEVGAKLHPQQLITHHFALDDILEAYNVFGNAQEQKAIKVIITPETVKAQLTASAEKRKKQPA